MSPLLVPGRKDAYGHQTPHYSDSEPRSKLTVVTWIERDKDTRRSMQGPASPSLSSPVPMSDTHPEFYNIRNAFLEDIPAATAMVAATPSYLKARNSLGETVLHWLAIEDQVEAARALLDLGAEVNAVNKFGDSVLMNAAQLNYEAMCALLLERGADPRYQNPRMSGYSVLSKAAHHRKPGVLRLVLSYIPQGVPLVSYFEPWDLLVVFQKFHATAELLRARGVSAPVLEE